MRQKINKYLYAGFIAFMLVGSLLLTSCEQNEEDLTTVALKVFGPSPALRGGELKFIGMNLDKVTAIVLQPNIEITTFDTKTSTEITITIPQNTLPGKVTLKTPQGDIVTKTELGFLEPISINSVAPASVKAGDKLTIEGDYLNLIAQVIFNDGVVVDSVDFISKSRGKIEVTVPIKAQTGKIVVSNGSEIPVLVYSENAIQVTLPAATALTPSPVKPGALLQMNGSNFQLVEKVIFPDNIEVGQFTVNAAKDQLTVTVPEQAKEGNIQLVAFSGVKVDVSSNLALVGPAITAIAPNPAKNTGKLTITGTNLDLVTEVVFTDNVKGEIITQSASSLEITVPATAKEGTVKLNTHSGKTAESAALGLVKPSFTSIAPLSLVAGNEITITGTNLDLVTRVFFGGGLPVEVQPTSATTLVVAVPMAATSGKVTLTTANGTAVESAEVLNVEAANKPVVSAVEPAAIKPGGKLILTGSKLHLVEAIYFGTIKAVRYGMRSETTIEVYVPENAKSGKTTVKLVAFDGAEVNSPEFTIAGTDPITADTKMIMDFSVRSDSDWHGPDWDNWGGSYDANQAKTDGFITLVARPGWWVLGCNHPAPSGWPSVDPSKYVLKVDIKATKPIKITGGYEFIFKIGGEDVKSQLMVEGDFIATPNNDWATITIPLTGLSNPTKNAGDFGIVLNYSDGSTDFSGLCFDNIRFDPK